MDMKMKTAQAVYPVVRYNDARAAIAWLASTLGFREHEVCSEEGDRIAHAELEIAGNLVMLASVKNDMPASTTYIALDSAADVDACYARARAAGAEIVHELCDTDYGSREFAVRDPEGWRWSFGTYRPSATSP
jgi:uncharacterized glyoxalase superfamily protein PhnB